MISDTTNWQNLKTPGFFPNEAEVEIYKKYIADLKPVYLLGMTQELAPYCDIAVDLTPVPVGIPTIQANWLDLTGFEAGAIIGDGVINLTGFELVDKMSKLTKVLVCRVFIKKLDGMKYATFFPKESELPNPTKVIKTSDSTVMVLWNFDEKNQIHQALSNH